MIRQYAAALAVGDQVLSLGVDHPATITAISLRGLAAPYYRLACVQPDCACTDHTGGRVSYKILSHLVGSPMYRTRELTVCADRASAVLRLLHVLASAGQGGRIVVNTAEELCVEAEDDRIYSARRLGPNAWRVEFLKAPGES